ncbi:hypothetical protein M413DRAFT_245583 [Hebeloma cylindrosporum]|uniref:Uncharacterized protein n=1 Tax=Hebeloma cylindrosporum TaxID=76867 RepID=A0A0C3C282_HEBCY|nr:hypothetical protein M413DRAFT_245583 [Hebeloma cylindrosporum h7]
MFIMYFFSPPACLPFRVQCLSMCMFGRKGSFRKRIGSTSGFSLFLFLFFALSVFFLGKPPSSFFPSFLISILMYSMPFFPLSSWSRTTLLRTIFFHPSVSVVISLPRSLCPP